MKHIIHYYMSLCFIVVIGVTTTILLFTSCTKSEKPEINIILYSPEIVIPAEGEECVFSFNTNADWNASMVSSSADSWCEIEPKSGNSGDNIIKVKIAGNEGYEERSATIILRSGSAVKEITISQKPKAAIIVSNRTYSIGASGGDISIEVKSNIDYDLSIPNDCNWIDLTSTRSLATSIITLRINQNMDSSARSCIIEIKSKDEGLSSNFSVRQRGFPILETKPASNVGGESATINGHLIAESESKPSVWFCFGKQGDSYVDLYSSDNRIESTMDEDGSFFVDLANLEFSTQYIFVACATVDGVDYFGELQLLKTEGPIEVITLPATDIEMFTGKMKGSFHINKQDISSNNVKVFFNYSSEYSTLEDIMAKGTRWYVDHTEDGYFEGELLSIIIPQNVITLQLLAIIIIFTMATFYLLLHPDYQVLTWGCL